MRIHFALLAALILIVLCGVSISAQSRNRACPTPITSAVNDYDGGIGSDENPKNDGCNRENDTVNLPHKTR